MSSDDSPEREVAPAAGLRRLERQLCRRRFFDAGGTVGGLSLWLSGLDYGPGGRAEADAKTAVAREAILRLGWRAVEGVLPLVLSVRGGRTVVHVGGPLLLALEGALERGWKRATLH